MKGVAFFGSLWIKNCLQCFNIIGWAWGSASGQ